LAKAAALWYEKRFAAHSDPVAVAKFFLLAGCFLLLVSSCSPHSVSLPTVGDEKLETFVADEARRILKVAAEGRKAARYEIGLVDFPRKDILGLSIGKQRIFISYHLSRLAYEHESYRWILRQTLAHEIAHDVLGGEVGIHEPLLSAPGFANRVTAQDLGLTGGGSFRHYSQMSELAADQQGMEYWRKIGWDCKIWIRILEGFLNRGYRGDVDHPTVERHRQAVRLCGADSDQKMTSTISR
jgi:predicted Zn-dependent protease